MYLPCKQSAQYVHVSGRNSVSLCFSLELTVTFVAGKERAHRLASCREMQTSEGDGAVQGVFLRVQL